MDRAGDNRLSRVQTAALCAFAAAGGLIMWTSQLRGSITTAWPIALVLSAAVTAVMLLAVGSAFARTGCDTIEELLGKCLSRPVARIIMLLLAVWLAARLAQILHLQTDMTRQYLLDETPRWVIAATLAVSGLVVMYGGVYGLGRTSELLMLIALLPLAIMLAAGLLKTDYGELRVLLQPQLETLPRQITAALYTFAGAECMIFFIGRGKARQGNGKAAALAVAVAAVIAAVLFVSAVGILTIDGINANEFPLVEMARMINIGGVAMTERFDIVLLVLRTLGVIVQTGILLYCASAGLRGVFGKGDRRYISAVLTVVVVILSQVCFIDGAARVINAISTAGIYISLLAIIPALFIASRFVPKRKEGANEERSS